MGAVAVDPLRLGDVINRLCDCNARNSDHVVGLAHDADASAIATLYWMGDLYRDFLGVLVHTRNAIRFAGAAATPEERDHEEFSEVDLRGCCASDTDSAQVLRKSAALRSTKNAGTSMREFPPAKPSKGISPVLAEGSLAAALK
jgi:hypothetical protein